jgi:hypothetical protein
VDPHANIPVISPVVCSLKGASWYEQTPLNLLPPGCYARPQTATAPTTTLPPQLPAETAPPVTEPPTTEPPPDCTKEERAVRAAEQEYQRLQDAYNRAVDRGAEDHGKLPRLDH